MSPIIGWGRARHTRGVWGRGEEGISQRQRERKEKMLMQVWDGGEGRLRRIPRRRIKAESWRRMSMMWHRWGSVIWKWLRGDEENGWMKARGHRMEIWKQEGVDTGKWALGSDRWKVAGMERDVYGSRCWKVSLGSEGGRIEQQRMKERCQSEVAFSVGQEYKCQILPSLSPLNLFFFQSPSPPSQPPPAPSTPPTAALLYLPTAPLPLPFSPEQCQW